MRAFAKASALTVAFSLALAGLLLATRPALWLVNTWTDPAYDSLGGYVYVVVVALFLWSAASAAGPVVAGSRQRAGAVLAGAALVLLAGRIAGANVLGAAALAADVYAGAVLAGLATRRRALAPGWLAVAFAFSLPLERIVERTVGFCLQRVAAAGACALLPGFFPDVACFGGRVVVGGKDVLVDLPTAGARGLLGLLFFFAAAAALSRPSWGRALKGLGLAAFLGFAANALGVTVLAVLVASPEWIKGADVMTSPWHDAVQLAAFGGAAAVLGAWFLAGNRRRDSLAAGPVRWPARVGDVLARPLARLAGGLADRRLTAHAALAFLLVSVIAVTWPPPASVRPLNHAPILPEFLDANDAVLVPLSGHEFAAFTRFDGGAAKARYGDQQLLVSTTTEPLRQLLAPDERLTASRTELTGVEYGRLPAAVYHSVAPDGRIYRIAVTYVAENGLVATSAAEVGWRWLLAGGGRWTALERTSYWDESAAERDRFDAAVARAFGVPLQAAAPKLLTEGGW